MGMLKVFFKIIDFQLTLCLILNRNDFFRRSFVLVIIIFCFCFVLLTPRRSESLIFFKAHSLRFNVVRGSVVFVRKRVHDL